MVRSWVQFAAKKREECHHYHVLSRVVDGSALYQYMREDIGDHFHYYAYCVPINKANDAIDELESASKKICHPITRVNTCKDNLE